MEGQLCVLLYSKYSQNSKSFMDMLQQAPIDFTALIGLNPLCIDNENIRQRILRSAQIAIEVVPCILLIYPDGGVEKYEGATAFKWAEEIVRQHAPPPPPIPTPPPPPPPPPQLPPAPRPVPNIPVDQDQDSEEDYIPPPKRRNKKQQSKSVPITRSKETAIDDLESEEEDEHVPRPPASIRSGVGNYDVQGQFGDQEEPNRQVLRGIKSTTEPGVGGKGGLMAAAQAMQKLREQADSGRRPSGAPPDRM